MQHYTTRNHVCELQALQLLCLNTLRMHVRLKKEKRGKTPEIERGSSFYCHRVLINNMKQLLFVSYGAAEGVKKVLKI